MKRISIENNLGTDSIRKLLFRLAIPAMLAQFVNVFYGIVDRIFISNLPDIGSTALAGVGVCAPILTLVTSFSFLVGLGGSPLLSMRLGEGKKNEAQKILTNCFVMLIALSIFVSVLFLIVREPMLYLFGASNNTIGYAKEYLTINLFGSIFAMLSLGLNGFISCQGFAKVSMTTVLIGAVLNIILDPILMFTFNMGVSGAAYATIFSQAISCFWAMAFLLGKRTIVKLGLKGQDIRTMLRVVKLGLSPFLIIATDSMVLILFNSVMQKYGGVEMGDLFVTAGTIVVSCMQLITMPMGGITTGCQPILSFNYGAKQINRVKSAFRGMLAMCLVFTSICFILTMSVPQAFVSIFTDDALVTPIAVWGIRVYTAGIIFLSVQYACVDALTALGQAGKAIALSLTRKIAVMTTLTLLLPYLFGVESTFFAEPIADIASCIISGSVFLLVFNKLLNKRLTMEI